jgi:hypothetical protein
MEAATRVARLCSDLAAAAGPRLGSAKEPALTTAWQRLIRCHRHVPVLLVRPHDARAHDAPRALRYAEMLEAYTRSEKLPWSELFVARGRALVRARQDGAGDDAQRDLVRIRAALVDAGLRAFLAPVDAMLAR